MPISIQDNGARDRRPFVVTHWHGYWLLFESYIARRRSPVWCLFGNVQVQENLLFVPMTSDFALKTSKKKKSRCVAPLKFDWLNDLNASRETVILKSDNKRKSNRCELSAFFLSLSLFLCILHCKNSVWMNLATNVSKCDYVLMEIIIIIFRILTIIIDMWKTLCVCVYLPSKLMTQFRWEQNEKEIADYYYLYEFGVHLAEHNECIRMLHTTLMIEQGASIK